MRLGVNPSHAYAWCKTRKGGWRIAQSPILGTAVTVNRLNHLCTSPIFNTINKFCQVNEGPVCPLRKIDLGNLFFEGEERSSRTQGGLRGADIREIW